MRVLVYEKIQIRVFLHAFIVILFGFSYFFLVIVNIVRRKCILYTIINIM